MGEKIEVARITIFYSKLTMRYGFAQISEGKEVFFHYGNGRSVSSNSDVPKFGDDSHAVPEPRIGDEIVCVCAQTPKGLRAIQWAYKSHWDEAQQAINERHRIKSIRENSPNQITHETKEG